MVQVRLADIARQADVSEATVSRVLNARPGVAEATRQAVLTALDVLGYERPSRLRPKSSGLIGLVVPELVNPIFPAFAQAIETSLSRHGYTPVLCTQTPGGVHEDEYVAMLLDRGVSGIVFISGMHADSTADPQRYNTLRDRGLPLVLVNGHLPGVDAPFVSSDDVAAMRMAVSHLVQLGHRRIGLAIGPERFVPARRKVAGYCAAVGSLLGSVDEALIEHSLFSVEGGALAAHRLIDRGATAVVCGSDLMALGAIRAVRARGLRVPHDVSVVGYDDSLFMGFTDPPLTTVRQDVAAMSDAVLGVLREELGGTPGPRAEFLYQPELVVRSSTAAVRRVTSNAKASQT